MKLSVVYSSGTGFTKNYAEQIAKKLNCSALNYKEFKHNTNTYDLIIYGGSIMANTISNLNNLKKQFNGKLIVFAVGATNPSDSYTKTIISANQLENVPFFYFPGGVCLKKLNFFKQTIFKIGFKASSSQVSKNNEEEIKDFDNTNLSLIEPLVASVGSI